MAAPSPGTHLASSPPSPLSISPKSSGAWTAQQDKAFEQALAMYDEDTPGRWEKVAARVPGKDAAQARRHYELLVEDVTGIEGGRIGLPNYSLSPSSGEDKFGDTTGVKKASAPYTSSFGGGKCSAKPSEQERKKGIPWTEDEHRLFLLGLDKFGKGDWRSISRNFVVSRTPTQVASHAQKYFIRLNSINKDKRRSSIHDITSVGNGENTQAGQARAITGQTSSSSPVAGASSSPSAQHLAHHPPPPPPPAIYVAPAVGQPIASPMASSSLGTPVLISSPTYTYASRPPLPHLPRPLMSSPPLPISASPFSRSAHLQQYSVPQSAMHQ